MTPLQRDLAKRISILSNKASSLKLAKFLFALKMSYASRFDWINRIAPFLSDRNVERFIYLSKTEESIRALPAAEREDKLERFAKFKKGLYENEGKFKKYAKCVHLLPSKNPEVVEIEQKCRELGVTVTFEDDLDTAKLGYPICRRAKEMGFKLPKEIIFLEETDKAKALFPNFSGGLAFESPDPSYNKAFSPYGLASKFFDETRVVADESKCKLYIDPKPDRAVWHVIGSFNHLLKMKRTEDMVDEAFKHIFGAFLWELECGATEQVLISKCKEMDDIVKSVEHEHELTEKEALDKSIIYDFKTIKPGEAYFVTAPNPDIAKEVSAEAADAEFDFVGEVFAGIALGMTYSDYNGHL